MTPSQEVLQQALSEMLLPEALAVPASIRECHNDCLKSLVNGQIEDAYDFMITIMEHYQQIQECVPKPTERLYFNLRIVDAIQNGPEALSGMADEPAAQKILQEIISA